MVITSKVDLSPSLGRNVEILDCVDLVKAQVSSGSWGLHIDIRTGRFVLANGIDLT